MDKTSQYAEQRGHLTAANLTAPISLEHHVRLVIRSPNSVVRYKMLSNTDLGPADIEESGDLCDR